jgi:hypothetical protein
MPRLEIENVRRPCLHRQLAGLRLVDQRARGLRDGGNALAIGLAHDRGDQALGTGDGNGDIGMGKAVHAVPVDLHVDIAVLRQGQRRGAHQIVVDRGLAAQHQVGRLAQGEQFIEPRAGAQVEVRDLLLGLGQPLRHDLAHAVERHDRGRIGHRHERRASHRRALEAAPGRAHRPWKCGRGPGARDRAQGNAMQRGQPPGQRRGEPRGLPPARPAHPARRGGRVRAAPAARPAR